MKHTEHESTKANCLRLMLADDHPVVRAGLKTLLSTEADFRIIAEAETGLAAVELAETLEPDLILMDVSLPGLSGAEATRKIRSLRPDIQILALSVHEEVSFARLLLDAGATGYALKRSACEELVRAVRFVAAGRTYIDPALAGHLMRAGQRRPSPTGMPSVGLSDREAEVVLLLAKGLTMKEMANQLGLSPRTLETYRARALDKLELKTRADLVRYALRCGWLALQ
ncbi:MAG TPA: response regulator transcription factor [Polyangiaceae bacterium]|nr:response regulator transcription factor [Polyangiaceae bacterium]